MIKPKTEYYEDCNRLIKEGKSNMEIVEILGCERKYVKSRRCSLKKKKDPKDYLSKRPHRTRDMEKPNPYDVDFVPPTFQEIAAALGCSELEVERDYHIALEKMLCHFNDIELCNDILSIFHKEMDQFVQNQ